MQVIGSNSNLQLRPIADLAVQVDAGLRRTNVAVSQRQLLVRRGIVRVNYSVQRRWLPLSDAGFDRGITVSNNIVECLGPVGVRVGVDPSAQVCLPHGCIVRRRLCLIERQAFQ